MRRCSVLYFAADGPYVELHGAFDVVFDGVIVVVMIARGSISTRSDNG